MKIIAAILAGFTSSQILYPMTHGENPPAPETLGIVLGSLLVIAVYKILGATDEDIQTLITAFASVGIGVGVSRVVLLLD